MVCSLALGVVGLGSLAFHGTLKYEAQLLDEIPMIWAASAFAFSAYETSPTKPYHPILLYAIFIATSIFIPLAYVLCNNPVFHQVAYGALLVSAGARVLYLLYSKNSPLDRTSPAGAHHTKIAKKLLFLGTAIFVSGFVIWNLDNVFCSYLRRWRNVLRSKHLNLLALVLQGHALWHICTGIGAWTLTLSLALVVQSIKEGPDQWRIEPSPWGIGWIFPSFVRAPKKIDTEPEKVRVN